MPAKTRKKPPPRASTANNLPALTLEQATRMVVTSQYLVSQALKNGAGRKRVLATVHAMLVEHMEQHGLACLYWCQYVPTFNDGEPCEFTISGDLYGFAVLPSPSWFGKAGDESSDSNEAEDDDADYGSSYDWSAYCGKHAPSAETRSRFKSTVASPPVSAGTGTPTADTNDAPEAEDPDLVYATDEDTGKRQVLTDSDVFDNPSTFYDRTSEVASPTVRQLAESGDYGNPHEQFIDALDPLIRLVFGDNVEVFVHHDGIITRAYDSY